MKRVVVGIIIRKNLENADEFLLVSSQKDFGEFTGAYYPPGGHVELGETDEDALIREIKEELNLRVSPIKKVAEIPIDVKNEIASWWTCKIDSGELKVDTEEITDANWFTKEQMKKIKLWPATKTFFDTYI